MKKNIQTFKFILVSFLTLLLSCSHDSASENINTTPSELKITTEIVGATPDKPNGDGTGTVKFKASANNAQAFEILIDGKKAPMTNGELTYTFTTVGTNSFTVTVTAFNNGKSISNTTTVTLYKAGSQTALEIIKAMGTGFNLGNTFDNGINPTSINSIKSIIDLYVTAGMKHVRIPVSWAQSVSGNTLANTATGKVDFTNPRFLELKAAIDYALSKNLYVVINTHHEHWLKDYYDGSATYNTKFTTIWTDVANYFKSYSSKLIFDVLNEPEGTMGQWGAEAGFAFPIPTNTAAISLTRQINKVGYDAIRATGGGNTTRIIMIEPNGQGNQGMIEEVYPSKSDLPGLGNDNYLAIQVHTYDPWAFCGQTGADSAYPGKASVTSAVTKVATHATLLGVPVNYGEFGVGRTSAARNTAVVYEYYNAMRKIMLTNNMSVTVWDDRGWFGLISSTDQINYTLSTNNIVIEMMK